jgi:hypothetical protein
MTTTQTTVAKRRRKTRNEWAAECRGYLQKTAEALIALGRTLTKAKRDLDQHGEWLPMLRDDLKMDVRFAQRVMALARNPRFSKAANLTHLPYALSALAEIARLSDDDFEAGKASGAINPSTTAKQARLVTVVVKNRTRKITSVGYVRPGPTYTFGLKRETEPSDISINQRPTVVYRPPDPLIADLAAIEERLCERLEGDRLERALAGLEQIRKALAEPTQSVVPLSPAS